MYIIEARHFDDLLHAFQNRGYVTIGPTVRDGAIMLDEIHGTGEMPVGFRELQSPAHYELCRDDAGAFFNYAAGPQSWKRFLYPPRRQLYSVKRNGKTFDVESGSEGRVHKYAFIGVRPCDLSAISIHDAVFSQGEYADSYYSEVRDNVFIVAANCTQPGGTCFCTSMKTGPAVTGAFDLSLTEIIDDDAHHFVVEVGSEKGQAILAEIEHREAEKDEIECAIATMAAAADNIGKSLDTTNIVSLLNANYEHPQWDDIAKRCLACTNCTMVCPTCFCSTVEDVTDLTGGRAERWRRWDSCFTADFTKIAGGNIRMSTRTRYRQWMMHKLAYWHEQFGTSGCVGCGRCITWCPAGIDITREATVIRETSIQTPTA